jgi:hypothetical protein
MATQEEKVAAASEALAVLGVTDIDEATRGVAIFWSQVPFLSGQTQTQTGAYAWPLVTDDPALQTRIDALNAEAKSIYEAINAS